MIVASWAISAVISIPPLFGWKTPDNDPDLTGICLISQVRRHATRPLKGAVHVLYNALGVGEGGVEILLYCGHLSQCYIAHFASDSASIFRQFMGMTVPKRRGMSEIPHPHAAHLSYLPEPRQ